jgi:hypothetical protein
MCNVLRAGYKRDIVDLYRFLKSGGGYEKYINNIFNDNGSIYWMLNTSKN